MKRFLKWWKVAGQLWGFVLLIGTLSGLMIGFIDEIRASEWLSIGWLILFFVGSIWYAWQMKVHGWELAQNIRDTH
jgi:hypothetical protein